MKKHGVFSRLLLLSLLTTTLTLEACTTNEKKENSTTTNDAKTALTLENSSTKSSSSKKEVTNNDRKTGTATYTSTLGSKENKQETKLTYENGKITAEETTEVIPYAGFGIKNKEEAEKLLSEKEKSLEGVEGVSYSIDYQDERAIESYKIDFTKVKQGDIAFLTMFGEIQNIDEAEKLLFEMDYKKEE
jgi:uncharacterized lipoprotein YehR (DUF1307 family)